MNKFIFIVIGLLLILNGGFLAWFQFYEKDKIKQEVESSYINKIPDPTPKALLAYTFSNLAQRDYEVSEIEIGEELEQYSGENYKSSLFSFLSDGKKVTGQINIPMTPESKKMPVIIMIRGWADRETYQTGFGTYKTAGVFASKGYVTIAPDFLGYGGSDMPLDDVWWDRFNNPVIVLNLIKSLESLGFIDTSKIGIWAHSNGGQIALSVLEISQKNYPTTLWAPVTKPFPYSILYFTDTFDDYGKALRAEIARLERDYEVEDYSITDHLDKISAPIQLNQGTADPDVPVSWNDEFVAKMEELEKPIEYNVWQGADHNMLVSWNEVVEKDLEFFEEELK